jgi:hypothetical protein
MATEGFVSGADTAAGRRALLLARVLVPLHWLSETDILGGWRERRLSRRCSGCWRANLDSRRESHSAWCARLFAWQPSLPPATTRPQGLPRSPRRRRQSPKGGHHRRRSTHARHHPCPAPHRKGMGSQTRIERHSCSTASPRSSRGTGPLSASSMEGRNPTAVAPYFRFFLPSSGFCTSWARMRSTRSRSSRLPACCCCRSTR